MLKKLGAVVLLVPLLLCLGGCPCGFDCDRDDEGGDDVSTFTLGMSATAVESIDHIFVEIDAITLRRANAEDVVIDSFTIADLDLVDSETFQIDLLNYRGIKQLEVIEDLEIDSGSYSQVLLQILDGDINRSFVEEADGDTVVLNVSSSQLLLPGFRVSSGNEQLTIEFNLGLALKFIRSSGTYLLGVEGARIVDNDNDSSIFGSVESSLFDTVSPCASKTDPLLGNLVYLYAGSNLSVNALADVYASDSSTTIGDNAIAPYSVTALVDNSLTGAHEYGFGFLPEDDYTVVFSCDALDDDPVDFDGITIPLPSEQLYEISLPADEQFECDFEDPADPSACGDDAL